MWDLFVSLDCIHQIYLYDICNYNSMTITIQSNYTICTLKCKYVYIEIYAKME